MKEKCSKCYEWKERSEFIPLVSGARPKCIACVDKQAQIEELKKEIERTSAKLASLKDELNDLKGISIPEPQPKNIASVKRVVNALRMHPRLPIGMKKGEKDKVYYYQNGAVKPKQVWDGKWGKYTSYKDPKSQQWKYIGLDKLEKQIFANDSKLGV
jgi:hypothetical protein